MKLLEALRLATRVSLHLLKFVLYESFHTCSIKGTVQNLRETHYILNRTHRHQRVVPIYRASAGGGSTGAFVIGPDSAIVLPLS